MKPNQEMIDYWNGDAGRRWVKLNRNLDELLQPIGDALLEGAQPQRGESAIDIGCGCGTQTLMLARRLGSEGRILGVDISGPMLEVAREHAALVDADQRARIDYLQSDASTHAFEAQSADLLFSRFGVMFFDAPGAAFANLRTALKRGGRLAFACWRPLPENNFMAVPLQAALTILPKPEPLPPDAPGPFAFADPERVRRILTEAGYSGIVIEPRDEALVYGTGLELEEAARRLMELGPVARLVAETDAPTTERVHAAIVRALEPHHADGALRFTGCWWLVRARNA